MAQEQHLEQLSSLIDGELDDARARFLAARIVADGDLAASWQRYHLIGASLRRERRPGAAPAGAVRARVAAALAEERPPERSAPRVSALRPVAGLAVAAVVAVAAYALLDRRADITNETALAGTELERSVPPANANFDATPPLPNRPGVASQANFSQPALTDPRVQAYLLRHNEAAVRRGQALMPYIYMVTARPGAEQADAAFVERAAGE